MKSIQPIGENLIIFPLSVEETFGDSKIVTAGKQLAYGEIQAVSEELKGVYKVGDKVIFAAGAGITQQYNKKSCLWINGMGHPKGHVYGVELDKI